MDLQTYRSKRNFERTSEPRGKTPRKHGRSFVVQKHDARRLHYDFRLELDGVLLSWAVPKGPSLDPNVKRLAVQTEDHPLEYASFEGVIPQGEYGAGPVLVWDRGEWIPQGDPRKDYERGRLSFELHGEKLSGGFHLVRTRGDSGRSWLLIKRKDRSARRGPEADIVAQAPNSALSGQPLEAVEVADTARATADTARHAPPDASRLPNARKAKLPEFVQPQLATLVDRPPEGDSWLHELKLDGYRMQARLSRGKVSLLSRRGHDWTARVPTLAAELAELRLDDALLDGELVVLHDGLSDFQRLQNSLREGRERDCLYYAFDVLHLNGYDVREAPLVQRKQLLQRALDAAGAASSGRIRYSDHVVGRGAEFFDSACTLHAEGTIAKRAQASYASGRSRAWLKVKCLSRQEFVIAGFTPPKGSRKHLGALLLGVQDEQGLRYAGKVGTGFTQASLAELHQKLRPLERKTSPLAQPPRGADARGVHWVSPRLVAEVEFTERTRDGLVRHAVYRGLREDKPAREVSSERPVPADQPAPAPNPPQPALASVRLTHPDRVLYPDQGLTKADLALYYAQVAERMLPYVVHRPLMLVRCPEGTARECFFQKHPGKGLSRHIKRARVREKKGALESMYIEDAEGLLSLVQMGALEIHAWGSRVDDIERPDQVTFDLDPDEGLPWARMVEAAHMLRARLQELGLPVFLKTTGGKGLHLVVPLSPHLAWDDVKAFCKAIADRAAAEEPTKYLATISKAKRKGKILIDYLRNGRGATAVCPYSTRARAGAPVAAPVTFQELDQGLRPDQFTVGNLPARLARSDPWEGFGQERPKLTRSLLRRVGL